MNVISTKTDDRCFPSEYPSLQVWHAHILRPSVYRAACEALMGCKGGELIDHDPDSASDSKNVKRERVRRTRVVYRIIYGEEAPSDIWWYFGPGSKPVVVMGQDGKKHTLHVNPEESVWSLYKRVEVTLNIAYIYCAAKEYFYLKFLILFENDIFP